MREIEPTKLVLSEVLIGDLSKKGHLPEFNANSVELKLETF